MWKIRTRALPPLRWRAILCVALLGVTGCTTDATRRGYLKRDAARFSGGAGKVDRLVLIAPTQRGVADAARIFLRPERFLRRQFTREMVATWPFVAELMPEDGRLFVDASGQSLAIDVWDPKSWQSLIELDELRHGALARSLRNARELRAQLRSTPLPADIRTTVIAGDCVPTARRVLLREDGSTAFYPSDLEPYEAHLERVLFEAGDGTVPISSARGDGEAVLFCDGHQGIATDPNVHRALIRILRGE